MLTTNRSQLEAKRRTAERRQREDDATRLAAEVPRLTSLQFEVENDGSKYLWRILIDRAPALFSIPCTEQACRDGGHDVTWNVMRALRGSSARFEDEDVCHGQVRSSDCGRILRYVAVASYRDR